MRHARTRFESLNRTQAADRRINLPRKISVHHDGRWKTALANISAAGFLAAGITMLGSVAWAQPAPTDYLTSDDYQRLIQNFPPAPTAGSVEEQADEDGYIGSRNLIGTPRGQASHDDDVYKPEDIATRFSEALGVTLTDQNAQHFMKLMQEVQTESENQTKPIKVDVAHGGRHRPIYDHPNLPSCPLVFQGLPQTGSYPSGHAEFGWLWASILAQLAPDRAPQLLARGFDFGESRLVCGFHYSSDVVAGRFAAMELLAVLYLKPQFGVDLAQAGKEVQNARRAAANLAPNSVHWW